MTAHNQKKETKPTNTTVTFDYELYAHYLDDDDLTESQKLEFLETLWNILNQFVALGFNVHPLQQAKIACGEKSEKGRPRVEIPPNSVELVDQFTMISVASDDSESRNIQKVEGRQ